MRDTPPGTENQLDKLLAEHTAAFSEPVNDQAAHAAPYVFLCLRTFDSCPDPTRHQPNPTATLLAPLHKTVSDMLEIGSCRKNVFYALFVQDKELSQLTRSATRRAMIQDKADSYGVCRNQCRRAFPIGLRACARHVQHTLELSSAAAVSENISGVGTPRRP